MNSIHYMQKITEAATSNGAVFKSVFDLSLRAAQQVATRNHEFVRALAGVEADPSHRFDLDAGMDAQRQYVEHAADYFRDVSEICATTQVEITRQNAQGMSEAVERMAEQFGTLFRAGQFDGAGITEMMQESLRSVGAAYERMLGTSLEFTQSRNALGTPELRPVAGAAGKAPRAARKAA